MKNKFIIAILLISLTTSYITESRQHVIQFPGLLTNSKRPVPLGPSAMNSMPAVVVNGLTYVNVKMQIEVGPYTFYKKDKFMIRLLTGRASLGKINLITKTDLMNIYDLLNQERPSQWKIEGYQITPKTVDENPQPVRVEYESLIDTLSTWGDALYQIARHINGIVYHLDKGIILDTGDKEKISKLSDYIVEYVVTYRFIDELKNPNVFFKDISIDRLNPMITEALLYLLEDRYQNLLLEKVFHPTFEGIRRTLLKLVNNELEGRQFNQDSYANLIIIIKKRLNLLETENSSTFVSEREDFTDNRKRVDDTTVNDTTANVSSEGESEKLHLSEPITEDRGSKKIRKLKLKK
jgi:hypothetical protein